MQPKQLDTGSSGAGGSLYRPIFVGRGPELRQLQAAYDEAAQGHAALVAIAGEPGIGKTALCSQLAAYVSSRGGQVLWGHCAETDSVSQAYLPIVQALDTYAASLNTEQLEQELASSATTLARIVPEIRQRLAVKVEPAADPEQDGWRLFQSVVALLRSGAAANCARPGGFARGRPRHTGPPDLHRPAHR